MNDRGQWDGACGHDHEFSDSKSAWNFLTIWTTIFALRGTVWRDFNSVVTPVSGTKRSNSYRREAVSCLATAYSECQTASAVLSFKPICVSLMTQYRDLKHTAFSYRSLSTCSKSGNILFKNYAYRFVNSSLCMLKYHIYKSTLLVPLVLSTMHCIFIALIWLKILQRGVKRNHIAHKR